MVFVLPICRIPGSMSIFWGKENLVGKLSILSCLGMAHVFEEESVGLQGERPRRDITSLCRVRGSQGPAFTQGPPIGWSLEHSVALWPWLAPSLGKCGFLECRLERCSGADSLVIARECIKASGDPGILPATFCFPQNRIVFIGASVQWLEWWGACTCCSLVAAHNPFSQPFLLPTCRNSDDFLQHTVNFSAASCAAHWHPLCFNGHPSFLFMSLILTPGPLPLPFAYLNRCFFFFF